MFAIVVVIALISIFIERLAPAQALPKVRGWWWRVLLLNAMQLGIVVVGIWTWDAWFKQHKVFALGESLHPFVGGLLTYAIMSFVFYWWHRWRHESGLLWRLFHQVHHSPQRIETITTFYKHPLEIFANSLMIGLITYVLLGMPVAAAAWALAFSCSSEFFFHMNIKTPHWLGYFIQRPEMHRLHHRQGAHTQNYADLPIWDMLFGTYQNPKEEAEPQCGFAEQKERRLGEMLLCKDLHERGEATPDIALPESPKPPKGARDMSEAKRPDRRPGRFQTCVFALLIAVGMLQLCGKVVKSRTIRGLGAITMASPLPLVFTDVKGVETFASTFRVAYVTRGGRTHWRTLTPKLYGKLRGPYNWRNVYGAAFAYGPMLPKKVSQSILRHGFFKSKILAKQFGITEPLREVRVYIKTRTRGRRDHWIFTVRPNNRKRQELSS